MSSRLFPASMDTFLPLMLMSPLGAEMLIPVKAPMFTSPQGDAMLTSRPSVDPVIL